MLKNHLKTLFTALLSIGVLISSLFAPAQVLAGPNQTQSGETIPGGIINKALPVNLGQNVEEARTGVTFAYYFVYIWSQLITVGGFLVIIYFLWGAFDWISANGEAGKISSARNKMSGAFAGFLVLIGSFVIISFIGNLFGIDVLNPTAPKIESYIVPAPDGPSNNPPVPQNFQPIQE